MLLSPDLPQPVTRAGQTGLVLGNSKQFQLLLVLEITNSLKKAHTNHIHADEAVTSIF